MWNSKLNVQAIFESLDGEANGDRGAGQLTTFIRLKGCNLRCSYCDTKYSQEPWPSNWMSVEEIVEKVGNVKKITITGGEPLLQFIELPDLLQALITSHSQNFINCPIITIETNGSLTTRLGDGGMHDIWKHPNIRYVVDYKLPSSGMEHKMEVEEFAYLRKTDIIKFVIAHPDDYERAFQVITKYGQDWKAGIVFSPTAIVLSARSRKISAEERIHTPAHVDMAWPRKLAEMMIKDKLQGIQYSLQIHKVLWPGATEER